MRIISLFTILAILLSNCSLTTNVNQNPMTYQSEQIYPVRWVQAEGKEKPWLVWSKNINWVQVPTEQEIVRAYYEDVWQKALPEIKKSTSDSSHFNIIEFQKIEFDTSEPIPQFESGVDRQAFIAKYTPASIIEMQVKGSYVPMLIKDGWKVIN